MNTENNSLNTHAQQVINSLFARLDRLSAGVAIETTLNELQVCIERVTFYSTTRNDTDFTPSEITFLLQDDVSIAMLSFMEWIAQQGLSRLFIAEQGRQFLSYASRHYRNVPEITVIIPISFNDEFISSLTDQLRAVHPLPARIIFRPEQSVIAGCVIQAPQKTYDYSLRHTARTNIAQYVQRRAIGLGETHG